MSDESMDEMEMDPDMQNIIFNCEEILSNIELDLNIQLFEDLYHEQIYIEMFKKMFPFMSTKIDTIEKSPASTGEKLQQLINCLSSDILTMDLTHIKGQDIADRDSRPLNNFLQIILELSKLQKDQGQNIEDDHEEKYDDHQQRNQLPQHLQLNNRPQPIQHGDDEGDDQAEPIEEGIYREQDDEGTENAEYNEHDSQVAQAQVDYQTFNVQQPQQRLSKKKSQQNLIQDENKQTFNPHTGLSSYPQQMNHENEEMHEENGSDEENYAHQTLSEEQRIDTEKIQELFGLFKAGLIVEDDPRLEELHFLLSKYGLNLESILQQEFFNQNHPQVNQQFLSELDNQDINVCLFSNKNGETGDSTLAQVIKISQSRLERMKNPRSFVETDTNNIIYGKQQNYQKFLKDYKRDYERKMKKTNENNERAANRIASDQRKSRFIEHEDKMLRKEYEDEQKSLYFQMRDKKVQYLRNIHKIIFELEKKKIIDEQNEYNEKKRQMEDEAKNRLISIENKYKNRIQMLKEGLEQKKRERHLAEVAQKQELSRQEKELKERKRKQIEDLKDLWKSEREKFDMITKDDRKLENQILELYKKY